MNTCAVHLHEWPMNHSHAPNYFESSARPSSYAMTTTFFTPLHQLPIDHSHTHVSTQFRHMFRSSRS